ncbi:SRPBCC domain-containing protein [Frankia sp. AgB32]|uniref:SRPBCC domain-containing protein n=1 Tax=Frankia sp. AgB32 TaxID=631119 RepID=UPI002010C164|nr:SRPBCC domain-containing protein [Frankia sp. AgB32]MCK9893652.1 SRPBCC domain-containing protein [Frankia sp. AgB32]
MGNGSVGNGSVGTGSVGTGGSSDAVLTPAEQRRPVLHGSFTVQRVLALAPARVFAGFADEALWSRWTRLPGPAGTAWSELDLRPGGSALARNTFVAGGHAERLENRARFLDVVPDARIVYAYEAVVNDVCQWVSLVTVELGTGTERRGAAGERVAGGAGQGGTVLTWTEQYAFLVLRGDGADDVAHLRGGTLLRLNGLESALLGTDGVGPIRS